MIITAAIALCFAVQTKADEGMWMLPLLEKINSEALANLGSRLTPDQIYSINHSSIKDDVVQFGGGCTGEIISETDFWPPTTTVDMPVSKHCQVKSTITSKTGFGLRISLKKFLFRDSA